VVTWRGNTHIPGEDIPAGRFTFAKGRFTFVKGRFTFAKGRFTFAKGRFTFAKGRFTFAKGRFTFASSVCSAWLQYVVTWLLPGVSIRTYLARLYALPGEAIRIYLARIYAPTCTHLPGEVIRFTWRGRTCMCGWKQPVAGVGLHTARLEPASWSLRCFKKLTKSRRLCSLEAVSSHP